MQFRQNQASHAYKGLQKLLDLFRMDLADQTWEGMLGLFGDPLTLNGAWQLLWGYLEVPGVLVSSHGIGQALIDCPSWAPPPLTTSLQSASLIQSARHESRLALNSGIAAKEVPRIDLLINIEEVITLPIGNDDIADALKIFKILYYSRAKEFGLV